MLNIGVIGYGYWGPNIVRNFSSIEGARLTIICDRDQSIVKKLKIQSNGTEVCSDCKDVMQSKNVDAVAIVTPVSTHYELAKEALINGKHVFVEKPFTANVAQAARLIDLAEKKNLKIMVDHTFLFTGAVQKIKEIVEEGKLGDLYYYDSTRVNLGLFQHDTNVIYDLAPHDFSIMDFVIDENPVAVTASGKSHINGFEDIAYITVHFDNNVIAHFNVNWLSPVKVRSTLIGGKKKMLVWNDVNSDEKIKVYDKGIEVENREGIYNLLVSYRSGDMWAPKVEQKEALKLEAEYFLHCINHDETPINDGHAGLRVVQLLEACNESLKKDGSMVKL
jgi:predicted dehydrogenase